MIGPSRLVLVEPVFVFFGRHRAKAYPSNRRQRFQHRHQELIDMSGWNGAIPERFELATIDQHPLAVLCVIEMYLWFIHLMSYLSPRRMSCNHASGRFPSRPSLLAYYIANSWCPTNLCNNARMCRSLPISLSFSDSSLYRGRLPFGFYSEPVIGCHILI